MTVNQLKRQDSDYSDWRWDWYSFDFYKKPDDFYNWKPCPDCRLRPKVWIFDNGRHAHCVCGSDRYNHTREVSATPIGKIFRETGGFAKYKEDELRINWNKSLTPTKTDKQTEHLLNNKQK